MTPGDPVENLTPDELEAQRRRIHMALGFGCVMDVAVAIVLFAAGLEVVGAIVILVAVVTMPLCWRIIDRQIDQRVKQASGPQPL